MPYSHLATSNIFWHDVPILLPVPKF